MTDSAEYDSESGVTVELNTFAKEISGFAYNATEKEKKELLALLKTAQILKLLESWRNTDRRRAPRKPCSLAMYFGIEDRVLKGLIKNVSITGVFIETSELLSVGKEITMTLWPANQEEPIETKGEIVWSGPKGVGVRFSSRPGEGLETLIESL